MHTCAHLQGLPFLLKRIGSAHDEMELLEHKIIATYDERDGQG
jgi:hypothetical protein